MFASLRVVTPPEQEPVDVELVRRHCRVDADYDDDLLVIYAASARQWAEAWLNRALITQELRYTISHSPPPTASPLVPQSLIVFPLNWPPLIRRPIALPRAPCTAVKSVAWGPADEELQPAASDLYAVNLGVEPAQVMIRHSLVPIVPTMSVAFDFIAGYGEPDDVPGPIKSGILLLTAYLYEGRGDVNSEMPEAPWQLMAPYRLWTFSG
ncbi:MAG TPA: head-tail connector protein [Xanthobacteraceae bacterium]|nr:head-tail connector protein [Xanthobacteraceae bacterium]